MLRKRALAGVAGRERVRLERAVGLRDVGGVSMDGCLGVHSVRLLAWPDDSGRLAVVVDGKHRKARTVRGVLRCLAMMIVGGMVGKERAARGAA